MSRKQREQQREQQRKERKRQRVEAARSVGTAVLDQHREAARVAAEIADQLGETEDQPRAQIERIVQHLGVDTALAWLQETLEIEAQGGMWLGDGSRRKTPGGVYFKLVQRRAAKTDVLSIFFPEYEQVFPLDERELTEQLAGAASWPLAVAQQIYFSIMGRPAAIAPPEVPDQAPYVIFDLVADPQHIPQLIKGLPPVTAPTSFRVLAPTHQWPQVASALIQQPDAPVIVSGYPALDPRAANTIVVGAMNCFVHGQASRRGLRKPAPAAQPAYIVGTVKWFNAEKGYGFITTAERGDVFVHQTRLAAGRATLAIDEPVYLSVREGQKGPEAADVHVGAPPAPPGPALPSMILPHAAIPARIRLRLVARPAEVVPLGRPNQPPSLIGFRVEAGQHFPAGLPAPASATVFAVLISLKHWKHVRDTWSADTDDQLVINGYCSADPRTPGMILVRTTLIDTQARSRSRNAANQGASNADQHNTISDA
jgi:CspA family cold shock protein